MRATRRHAWLRVLVLLVVAMLATGPHPEALAAPPLAVAAETGGLEQDVLDTALRPPARHGHRPLVPLRPAPRPDTGRPEPTPLRTAVPSPPPYALALHVLRCVVLRC
ncbi:hypothetical protein [Streptomyces sp. NPDC054842]